jgi:hypothetical protein
MNILLLSSFARGSTSSLIKRGFEQAGHHVIAASPDRVSGDWLACDSRVHVPRLIAECSSKPDIAVYVESNSRSRFFPEGLLEAPVPTAFWAVDNHLNYRWHKEYSNQFDVTFFAQKDYIRAAHRYGSTNIRWLPLAADAEYHRIEPRPGKYGVSFIGNVSRSRRDFFDSIDRDIPLNIMSGIYEEEMAQVLAESKIGLNVSIREDLNMRFFEVLASGALLVTQKIGAGMSELFEDGTHFVTHRVTNVSSILKYYLENEPIRAQIAHRGRELCLSRHTYKHRCDELLEVVLSDAEFLEKRHKKIRSYRLDISRALVFAHPTFRMREEARKSYRQAIQKSRFGTYFYILKYFTSYLKQSIQKTFRKTRW